MKDRVAIVGSRSATAIDIAGNLPFAPSAIISGGAKGVDTLAAEYAKENGIELIEFRPQYALYGRFAPLKRNDDIVAACDVLIAFWDGASRGTKYTIERARKLGKEVIVVRI